jgi:plastocyanin
MRLRTIVGGVITAALLLTFLASDAFAQRRGGGWGGGYRGGYSGGYRGGYYGGYRGGWGYGGWGYPGVGIYLGGLGRGYYGGGYPDYYSGSYAYPAYSYSDTYAVQPAAYEVPSTSYYYSPSTTTPAQPPQTVNIDLNNKGVSQSQVTIPRGSTVYWNNNSGTQQTVVSDQGLWNSGPIAANYRYNCTFNQPGTYTYHSDNNPALRGTIVVQ